MNQRQKLLKKSNLSWPDVVFLAEAEREEFADVQIITLYSHCLNVAENILRIKLEDEGWGPLGSVDPKVLRKQFEPRLRDIIPSVEASEHILIESDRIVICIDSEIVDDETIANALDMLTTVEEFQVGAAYYFPPNKSFKFKELN